jgi:hypothetical protein
MANTNLNAVKYNLMKYIMELEDAKLLEMISNMFNTLQDKSKEQENWVPSQSELDGILLALSQANSEELVSLEDAKERHKKWLK